MAKSGKKGKQNVKVTVTRLNKTKRLIVKYNSGTVCSHIAFVFACPGAKEARQNKVCAGTTGNNLDTLLAILHGKKPHVFISTDRYDYLLTNSCERVHYKRLDGKYSPTTNEILCVENLKRLETELKNVKIIVTMGADASLALSRIRLPQSICLIDQRHLSLQSLNRWKETNWISKKSVKEKLEVIAEDIISKI